MESDSARQGSVMKNVNTRGTVTAAEKATIMRPAAVYPKLACSLVITCLKEMFPRHPSYIFTLP